MFRRLHKLDRVILLIAVPLWLVCFTLGVQSVLKPGGSMPIRVTMLPAADEYVEIVAMASHEPVAAAGVRLGDRLIEIDGADLQGANGLDVWLRFVRAAWEHPEVPTLLERDGRRFAVAIPPIRLSIWAPLVAITPIFLIFGIAILLKGPRSGAVRAMFHLFIAVALFFSGYFTGPGWVPVLSMIVFVPVATAAGPLMIRTLLVFPHGVMPRSRWLRALPYPFAIVGLAQTSMILGIPYSGRYVEPFAASQTALALVVALALAARVYRRADPVGRRQLKVSFLGIYLACIPGLLAGAWLSLHPEDWPTLVYAFAALGLAPGFIYLALHRYDVFDVDGLLSATAAYNVVLFLLAGGWLFLAPQVGELAAAQLGIPASTGQIAASIGLAALIIPAQRRLQPRLEALFFKQRHALEETLTSLANELETAPDAKSLLQQLGGELHARVRPESTVLYGRDGARYVALFVEGRGVAAELPADGPVVSTLCSHHGPVCVDGSLAGHGERTHDPFVRAALEVLNASVVIPIAGGDGPPGTFVALGAKRSGDLYTGSELHLLRSLADRAALELQRFGEQETRAQSHAMHEAMRRYVPGTIAEHIERGDALEPSEREVTVLFVDIRGYTTLSEGSRAEDVFSTINGYTRTVSELVRETGGTVVEFNGDGMMAVFGAPGELPEKERAAVRAARRIADEVAGLEHAARPLSVGVGVATGRAFVGNIQAADRMIWSAIGNTTNLAARLQFLTRELDVAVIIDAATQAALGDEGRRFRRHEEIAIRGRSERIDVFALRAGRPAPSAKAPDPSTPPRTRDSS